MAGKPQRRQVLNTQPVDPAVEQLLGNQERRQAEAHLSKTSRQRKLRQRHIDQQRKARRVNWDIREDIKERIQSLAETNKTSQSQVASLCLWIGLQAIRQGKIQIMDFHRSSKSPKYDSNLAVPEIDKDLF